MYIKKQLKDYLLRKLHAREEIVSRVATRVARDGLPRFVSWDFEREKAKTLRFLGTLQRSQHEYQFCTTNPTVSLYSSLYACLTLGMFGKLSSKMEADSWVEYFSAHQCSDDGYFRDGELCGPEFEEHGLWGDGWGKNHLAAHVVMVYAKADRRPPYALKFLERYYDHASLNDWLNSFQFNSNLWSQSNFVMNAYSLLQFSRDYMEDEFADSAVKSIRSWLLDTQNRDTGLWHDISINDYPELGDAIRAAYHYYPLFVYEGDTIPYQQKTIDLLISSQNAWGGFNPEDVPSGACEDIDALEPLIRAGSLDSYRQSETIESVQRAMVWVLSCAHPEGGYESIPEHGLEYGAHPATTSPPGEANLFATWFRTLCLAYIVQYLKLPNKFTLSHLPGYEIRLG